MRTAIITAAALAAAAVPAAADTWPLPAHDAANTARSAAVSAQRPALLPGWPVTGLNGTDVLIGAGGRPEIRSGVASPLVLNPNGTVLRRGTVAGLDAIGPDDRRYAFRGFGDRVAAYGPAGTLLWLSPVVELGPEASDRSVVPAPDGTVYVTGYEGVAALEGASGALRWIDRVGMEQTGALAVAPDGTVVYGRVGNVSGATLMARRPDGTVRWEVALGGRAIAVAIHTDGTVVVAQDRTSASGGSALLAFDADGAPLWSVPTGLTAPSAPAIGADGTVYAFSARGIIRNGRVASRGTMFAVAPGGAVRWSRTGYWSGHRPLIGGDGLVYAGGSPFTAVRPDGTVAWRAPMPLAIAPEAIGTDGTLFARAQVLTLFAFASPAAPASLPLLAPPRRGLLASAGLTPTFFRTTGTESLCTPIGRCLPARPLGATITARLAREALLQLRVRRASDGRLAARTDRRGLPGTNWIAMRDLQVLLPRAARGLPAGRYVLTVRAAAGRARATAGPIRFTVVGGAAAVPAG